MIFKTAHMPTLAQTGDVWLCPHKSFRRVLSRGGAWENEIPGVKHPDEKDHDDEQGKEPKAEQWYDAGADLSAGADQSAQGTGDDGEMPGVSTEQEDASLGDEPFDQAPPGVDANGSEVV